MQRKSSKVSIEFPMDRASTPGGGGGGIARRSSESSQSNLQRRESVATYATRQNEERQRLLETQRFEYKLLSQQQAELESVEEQPGFYDMKSWKDEILKSISERNAKAQAQQLEASGGVRRFPIISKDFVRKYKPGSDENKRLCDELGLLPHFERYPIPGGAKKRSLPKNSTVVRAQQQQQPPRPLGTPVDYGVLLAEQRAMMTSMEAHDVEYHKVMKLVESMEYMTQRKFSAVLKLPSFGAPQQKVDDEDENNTSDVEETT
eukprot:PhF_6_TR20787/c0_g1_i3/m.29845